MLDQIIESGYAHSRSIPITGSLSISVALNNSERVFGVDSEFLTQRSRDRYVEKFEYPFLSRRRRRPLRVIVVAGVPGKLERKFAGAMDDAGRRSGPTGCGGEGRLNGGRRGARWSRAASPRRSLSRLIVRSNEVEGTLVAGSNEKQDGRQYQTRDASPPPNAPTPRNDATASATSTRSATSPSLHEGSLALDTGAACPSFCARVVRAEPFILAGSRDGLLALRDSRAPGSLDPSRVSSQPPNEAASRSQFRHCVFRPSLYRESTRRLRRRLPPSCWIARLSRVLTQPKRTFGGVVTRRAVSAIRIALVN